MPLSPEQIMTIILAVFGGIGAVWAGLMRYYVAPKMAQQQKEFEARLEQQRQEFEARVETDRDSREHSQKIETGAVGIMQEIMREAIKERSTEMDELRRAVVANTKMIEMLARVTENNGRKTDGMAQSVRVLAGVIESNARPHSYENL